MKEVFALYALDYLVVGNSLRAQVSDDAQFTEQELLTSERPPPAVYLGSATNSSSCCGAACFGRRRFHHTYQSMIAVARNLPEYNSRRRRIIRHKP